MRNGQRVQQIDGDKRKGEVAWDTYVSPNIPYSFEVLWDADPNEPNVTRYSQYSSLTADQYIKAL